MKPISHMRLRVTLLSGFAVMATLPSLAPARATVTPKAGQYWGPSVLPGGQVVPPGELGVSFRVLAGGTTIAAKAAPPTGRCGRPFVLKKIPIRNGSFNFIGTGIAVLHGKTTRVSVTWTGKWGSATSVSGTARYKTASCDSGLIRWSSKWRTP